MANCPNCSTNLIDDFGLVVCSHCGAQLLIGMDGTARQADAEPAVSATRFVGSSPTVGDPVSEGVNAATEYSSLSSLTENPSTRQDFALPDISANGGVDANPLPDFSFEEKAMRQPASPDMQEIADYGNSPISQAREGLLRFNLKIEGIDTADIRAQVYEVLSDARFLFDADKIIKEIHNGELKISDVTAVKSALFVQRLRAVPVQIRWEQYAINQS